jgi:hypothetical protein
MFKLKITKKALATSAVVMALAGPVAAAEPNLCQILPADTAVSVINNINHPLAIGVDHFRGVVYITELYDSNCFCH